ncbi:DUF305 domain-containing protein [Deinococcus multiflagellatus]|uniref:DUF305 domain-containing protein n=1 Tax=Deinococcus multiflagellatus TaxID=1656887 RepID=A0ABW1ZRC1_9DEIO|nr:DUF305 domain-containing protein [Deinococcus multiflagellatus]MBZ9715437.1 DUF305 domain-containing protein [Deinococcus multiflagellatus]
MANLALQQGQDAHMLSLSRVIITAQTSEMLDYRTWLKKRGLSGKWILWSPTQPFGTLRCSAAGPSYNRR